MRKHQKLTITLTTLGIFALGALPLTSYAADNYIKVGYTVQAAISGSGSCGTTTMPDGSSPDSVSATAPAGTGNEASGCVITGGTNNETGYIVTIKDADGDTNLNGDDTLDGTVGDATGEIIAPLPLQIGNYYHVGVMNETSCKGQQAEAQSCWAYLWYLDGYYSDQENDYIDAKYAHIIPNFAAGAGVDGLGQDADKDYTFFNPITTVDKEIYHTTGPSFDDNSKIQFGFWTTVDQAPGHYYDVVKLTFAANPLTPTP